MHDVGIDMVTKADQLLYSLQFAHFDWFSNGIDNTSRVDRSKMA